VVSVFLTSATLRGAQVQGGATPGAVVPAPAARPQQPPRDQSQPVSGTARLRGRVVAADDGRPIRRAVLRVSAPELREGRSTVTDPEGRYEFRDLPAGRFTVSAVKPGFVSIAYGQTRPNEPGRPIDVRDGHSVDRIDFALPRGAVITGRVIDEYGEPVANASVYPMQLRYVNGQRQPMMSGSPMQTPDTGEFRLWSLAPGEYLIQARLNNAVGVFGDSDDRSGYGASYYPGTPNAADAQVVKVEVGQTLGGVDIVLLPTQTARITGTTLDSRGQALRSGTVMATQRSESMAMTTSVGQIRPDGSFTISGVTPGSYQLRTTVPPSGPGAAPENLIANVTVTGEDVTSVVLTPVRPVTVTGRILFDPPSHSLEPSMIRIMATPKTPLTMPLVAPGPPLVRDDFTFELQAMPGPMIIRATTTVATDWTVKSVHLSSTDVTDDGIEFVSGRNVHDVEILMTNRVQTVTGVVTNTRGDIATDASVFIFSQDRNRWFRTPRFTALGRPDQNGRYTMRTLPPGTYYAVAVEYLDANRRGGDPEYLEELASSAVKLTLGDGEMKALDLKLSTLP
jgi:protocatechuate 3,4-dioxygenase beta subunit